jgi:hypothetical protein
MLKNTRTLQVLNLKADDLDNQLIDPNSLHINTADASNFYQEKINEGYIAYDIIANGGLSALATKTPGKYICVLSSVPTATYSCATSILSGSGGIAHTGIIITSAVFSDSVASPTSITSLSLSGFTSGSSAISPSISTRYDTLTIAFCNLTISGVYSNVWNIQYTNCNITTAIACSNLYNINAEFSYNSLNLTTSSASFEIDIGTSGTTKTLNITNNTSFGLGYMVIISYATSSYLSITNNYFVTTNTANQHTISKQSGTSSNVYVNNTYMESAGSVGATLSSTTSTFGISGISMILYTSPKNIITTTFGSVTDVIIAYPNSINKWVDGSQALNTALVQSVSASTLILDSQVSQIKRSIRGSFGTIRRQYYNIKFLDNHKLADELKNFDDLDRLVVYRPDLKTYTDSISAVKIKGYTWFDTAGTVKKYPRIDESFLILATYGTNTHVLGYHKGELRSTIYSDYYPTALYTVVMAFQIWEMPEEVEYMNMWNLDDSPISGSVQVQDITSKVVV